MGYVAIRVREDDLLNGIYLKAGKEVIPGEILVHLHEEDYRAGALVKGLQVDGRIVPHTWTDDSGDYRATTYPLREDDNLVDIEMYGGTREQYEYRQELHRAYCETHGWTQGAFVHFPALNL